MKLLLDPKGGIAGDMFAAALISAGADENIMINAMQKAANRIGESSIRTEITHDQSTRLVMNINHNHGHLAASKARRLLEEILDIVKIEDEYRDFASDVLEILIAAEKQAHAENTFLTDHHHHSDDYGHSHHHNHAHGHHHHEQEEAWLHEAQDILIDIIGAAQGLQLLKAPVTAELINPVSLGGGRIKFSHGEMDVPAPATKIILEKFSIQHIMGPLQVELCTPTGSAILAALNSKNLVSNVNEETIVKKGFSRGGKDLDIPPLGLYLTRSLH